MEDDREGGALTPPRGSGAGRSGVRPGAWADARSGPGPGARPEIRVANAPCSWGLIGQGDPGTGYARMLDELVETGYVGTELGDYGYMPTDPAALHDELADRGLTLLGAFAGVTLRERGVVASARERLLRLAALLAEAERGPRRPYLVLADADGLDPVRAASAGRVTPELGLSGSEWKVFAANAEEVARIVAGETGLGTVFHPHCAGFVETPDEVERFLDLTDPDLMGLVFDTGHHVYGSAKPDEDGQSAVAGLERFWDRVWYVHLKDVDGAVAERARRAGWDLRQAVRAGVFAELGKGTVDFAAVLDVLWRRGYSDWLTVEQDVLPGMGTPKESAGRNREFLRGLGL